MTLQVIVFAFTTTLFLTPGDVQGKDGAAKRAKRSLLPYTEILSGTTPNFQDLGRDVKPDERIPDITNSSDDYEEALMEPMTLGPLRQRPRKPWGEGRPKSRPQQ
ncbi:uncharacterized protein LOC125946677 [Dermacentor silvarum]|uniref:uncharacterized protein LOC125946677 n=1 Tax=Dermacentor silvarum TaxID=543639 RepID=UPI0021012519|nr:uncharacterized protein LOC125946677 [Dermacentor silvarum]